MATVQDIDSTHLGKPDLTGYPVAALVARESGIVKEGGALGDFLDYDEPAPEGAEKHELAARAEALNAESDRTAAELQRRVQERAYTTRTEAAALLRWLFLDGEAERPEWCTKQDFLALVRFLEYGG